MENLTLNLKKLGATSVKWRGAAPVFFIYICHFSEIHEKTKLELTIHSFNVKNSCAENFNYIFVIHQNS